jgi:hypothetical protein
MRRFALIAAMLLASASAHAGQSRGLALASTDDPAAVTPSTTLDEAKPSDPLKPLDAPKYAERPPLDTTPAPMQPRADKLSTKANARLALAAVKKRHHASTEARVISELHRHGIYW